MRRVHRVGISVLWSLACALLSLPSPAVADDATWTRQFGTGGLDEAKAVALGPAGDAWVAGETSGTLPGQTAAGMVDAFLARSDRAGRAVWTRQFGTADNDIAWAVAVDPAGAAYVVGQTEGSLPGQHSAGGSDAFVRKYDAAGDEVWTRQFGGGGGDVAAGVALDPAGGVYVAGTTMSALPGQVPRGGWDALVRKYDAAGNEVWTRQFGGPHDDNARAVTVAAGRLLVVGSTQSTLPDQVASGGYDAFVAALDPAAGAEIWTRQFGTAADDYGVGVAPDRDGGIVVVGSTDRRSLTGGVSTDAFIRRFDPAGVTQWTQQFGADVAADAWQVAVDRHGGAYVAGLTERVLPGQQSAGRIDAFVRRYDATGHETWTRQYGTPADDYAYGVAVDGDRGLVVAGSTRGAFGGPAAGNLDAYVLRRAWR